MEPHCAAPDALLKVHDRIVEEDRFGGVTFDDDNENSVVTTRLLVPNNMNPRKDKPPSGFPMPFLSPRNPMLSNRAPSHTMLPMSWTGGYENRSGFVQGGFNGFPPGHGGEALALADIHAQDASKDSEESVIHVSAFELCHTQPFPVFNFFSYWLRSVICMDNVPCTNCLLVPVDQECASCCGIPDHKPLRQLLSFRTEQVNSPIKA
ncbi:hypothetical protein ACFX1W_023869 [Malus domestica]